MTWHVDWDGKFVVGGDENRRLTPNFRLKEFRKADGSVRVHRELVSALQLLRSSFGKSIKIVKVEDDGLGARVAGDPPTELLQAADRVRGHHLFEHVLKQDEEVHVRIPDPDHLPEIDLEQALETAFSVTAGFETSGDRFQQVTGNFDGAGLSFGPAQWNLKTETLQPLLRLFEQADEPAFRACFTDDEDFLELQDVLTRPVREQVEWADSISTGRGKHDVAAPWKGIFQAMGRVQLFRAVMVEQALKKYGAAMLEAIKYLQGLKPGIRIDHLRCLCALYDLVIQQGSLHKARRRIEERVGQENPQDQFHLVRIAVEERGRTASVPWRADCESRRVGILEGVPVTVAGRQRANIHFFLLRDVRIRGAADLMKANVSEQLARVSQAIAAGETLLA